MAELARPAARRPDPLADVHALRDAYRVRYTNRNIHTVDHPNAVNHADATATTDQYAGTVSGCYRSDNTNPSADEYRYGDAGYRANRNGATANRNRDRSR